MFKDVFVMRYADQLITECFSHPRLAQMTQTESENSKNK